MNRIVMMVLKNFWRVPWAYLKLCHYAKHTDEYPEMEKYQHIQYIFKKAIKSGNIDMKIYGEENIPKEDGYLMISNHQGLFDILAICAYCDRPWGAILKKELYSIPFLKQMVDCTKSFPMDRDDIKQSMEVILAVTKEIQGGRNYLIFPEGTRSKNGNEMLEFHGGSFKCALKAKCPILPIALVDCYKAFDRKGSKPISAQIHYLEPIPYEEYKGMKTVEIAALVRARIEETVKKYSEEDSYEE